MPPLPLGTLARAATDVVRARVLEMRPVIPAKGISYNEVDLELSWALKGLGENFLTIHVPGVADATHPTIVEHDPHLAIGEDVVLFLLLDDQSGAISILGLDQGVYRIVTDTNGQEVVFGNEAQGAELSAFIDGLDEK
jgi:hypothetical protein